MSDTTVREATRKDRPFVMQAVKRLSQGFTPPRARTRAEIWKGEKRTLVAWFGGKAEGALLVAERDGERIGFVFLEHEDDYFTGEPHGHVGILAVVKRAEGSGVGRALMKAAERWASSQGYRKLTLNVFEQNERARALYRRAGFKVDTIHYAKRLKKRSSQRQARDTVR